MRLIDAMKYENALMFSQEYLDEDTLLTAVNLLAMQPTVDAVPVVRCKDCKHMHIVGHSFRWCKVWERIQTMGDDGYCCFGDRRDDNES